MLKIANTWAEDINIHAWCMENYGQPLQAFVGINEDNPPAASDYPLLAVTGVTRRSGTADMIEVWEAVTASGVADDAVETQGRVTVTSGIMQAEQLLVMGLDALKAARIGKLSFTGEYSQINFDGIFISYDTVRLEVPAARRRLIQ